MKLTAAQLAALRKLDQRAARCSKEMTVQLPTLYALERAGLAERERRHESGNETIALFWRMTQKGLGVFWEHDERKEIPMANGETNDDPKISVMVELKRGLPNWSNATASIHIGGLRAGATPEEIEALLDTGRIAYDLMRSRLIEKVDAIAADEGYPR